MRRMVLSGIALMAVAAAALMTGCATGARKVEGPPPSVVVVRNVEYGKGGDRALVMDICYPEQRPEKPMPAIAFIHGGAWREGDKSGQIKSMLGYAERGYFCASVGYRLTQEAVFPAQIYDAKCAIRFLRAHAEEYGINPQLIGVTGGSAGGHLAALLGTSGGVRELEGDGGWPEHSSRVQAVCDYFGPSDFEAMAGNAKWMKKNDKDPKSAVYQLMGGPLSENLNKARLASPAAFVSKDDPPFLIFHGTKDWTVPYAASTHLLDVLQKGGVEAELITIEGGGHGDWKFYAAKPWEPEAAFFDRHLKRGN